MKVWALLISITSGCSEIVGITYVSLNIPSKASISASVLLKSLGSLRTVFATLS